MPQNTLRLPPQNCGNVVPLSRRESKTIQGISNPCDLKRFQEDSNKKRFARLDSTEIAKMLRKLASRTGVEPVSPP